MNLDSSTIQFPSSRNPLAATLRQIHWPTLVSGLVLGVVGMHLMIAWPMAVRLEGVQRDLATVNRSMLSLTGSRDDVRNTNDLLTLLKTQHQEMTSAQNSLTNWRQLRTELEAEARKSSQALTTVRQLAQLQNQLLATQDKIAPAHETLAAVNSLNKQVTELAVVTRQNADEVKKSNELVQQLGELKQHVLAQAEQLEAAQTQLTQMKELHGQLAGAAELTTASRQIANDLVMLQTELVTKADKTEAAKTNATALIGLQDELNDTQKLHLAQADRNLQALVRLQGNLSGKTEQIAGSVQNLELLNEFQKQFSEQMDRMTGIQRNLADIMLMENTLSRVTRMLLPLAELGNIRGLADDEMRQAARIILDRRHSRLSTNDPKTPGRSEFLDLPEPSPIDRVVPVPAESN